jgi:hypothetical protein
LEPISEGVKHKRKLKTSIDWPNEERKIEIEKLHLKQCFLYKCDSSVKASGLVDLM